MKDIIEKLKKEDIMCIFDIDGTLASFEYGKRNHICVKGEDFEKYLNTHHPYTNPEIVRPFKKLQKFIQEKNEENICVCSVATTKIEKKNKIEFLKKNYGIKEEQIFFVKSGKEKLNCLRKIHEQKYPQKMESQIALIDDTISILNDVFMNSAFMTIHVSSFFD